MGLGLDKCCSPHQNYPDEKQFSKIADDYLGDIAHYSNVSHEVPHYQNVTHCCLVNKLMQYDLKFTDEVYPSQLLMHKAQWRRISQALPLAKFSSTPNRFEVAFQEPNRQSPYCSRKFIEAIQRLESFPNLIEKIFPNRIVSSVGFYALYFCINGKVEGERREIIIDDFIPMDNNGEYLGSRVYPSSGIWSILVEKALAKCLGAYSLIDYLSAEQIFSEITGVPVPSLYHHNDWLTSSLHEFGPEESRYIRIITSKPSTKLIFSIWESCSQIEGYKSFSTTFESMPHNKSQKFVIDFIPDQEDLEDLPLKAEAKRVQNKLVLFGEGGQMMVLPKGRYILHIFNRSHDKIACNLLLHSNSELMPPTAVFGEPYQAKKMKVLWKMYQRVHNSRPVVYEYPGIALRIAWLGPRAVICLKNESGSAKTVRVEMTTKEIFLEDNMNQRAIERTMGANHHEIFIVMMRWENSSQQFGKFYSIKLLPDAIGFKS